MSELEDASKSYQQKAEKWKTVITVEPSISENADLHELKIDE